MLRRHCLAALCSVMTLVGLGFAPAVEDEITGDLKIMQGRWIGSLPDGGTVSFAFEKNKATTVLGDTTVESEVSIDEKAEPTKTVDFKIESGPGDVVGQTALGIYKFEGENKKLVLAIGYPGQARPDEFEPVEGAVMVFELDRDDK